MGKQGDLMLPQWPAHGWCCTHLDCYRPLALWVTPWLQTGALSSFSACSQKRVLTWDTWVSKQGVTVQLNTQKPSSLNLSAAHAPTHLIHYLICLDGCVPSQHLDHGKRCYTGFGWRVSKSWKVMGNRSASEWAPMDVSIALAQCHDLQAQWFVLSVGSELDQPVQQFRSSRALTSHIRPPAPTPAVAWAFKKKFRQGTRCSVLHCTARQEYPVIMWNHWKL